MKVEVESYWIYRVLYFNIMKLTKRKQFAFYRSYYDVFNELSDTDKLKFIKALLDKQFLDKDPEDLSGMVKFAYISQMDSIEKQVKGYCDKTKTALNTKKIYPWQGGGSTPNEGGADTPKQQEKEKEKEKEEDDVYIDINKLRNNYLEDSRTIKAVLKNGLKGKTENDIETLTKQFNEHLESNSVHSKTKQDYASHFLSWAKKQKSIKGNKNALKLN